MKYKLIKDKTYKIIDENSKEVPIPPQPRYITVGKIGKLLPNKYSYNEWVEIYFNKIKGCE